MRRWAWIVLIVAWLASIATPQSEVDQKVLDLAESIEGRVAELRGHPFLHEVTKGIYTREQLLDFVLKSLDEELPPEKAGPYGKSLKILGFIPPEMDLRQTLAGFLTLQIGGFYDPESKTLRCITSDLEFLQHIVMVHEIEHALQDQQFDLMRHTQVMDELADRDEDLQRAIQAVVEGDAQFVSELYPQHYAGAIGAGLVQGNAKAYGRFAVEQLVSMSAAPPILMETMTFPYMSGSGFIGALHEAGGWERVDRAFARPPLSTEQILHPEKYLAGDDPPLAIETVDVSEVLGGAGSAGSFRRIASNTMGEFGVRLWMQLVARDMVRALRAAPGWGGDRYDVYEEAASGRLVLAWLTVWDSEKDARQFLDGARVALRRRHAVGALEAETDDRAAGFSVRGETTLGLAEIRDLRVLVIDGLSPRADLDAVAEAAWKGRVVGPKKAVDLSGGEASTTEGGEPPGGASGR